MSQPPTNSSPSTMQQGNALVNTHKVPSFQPAFFDPSTSSLQAQPVSSGGLTAECFWSIMQQGNALVKTHKVPSFQPAFFDPSTSSLQAQPVSSGGRQAAWFVQLPNAVQGVLRHYRRGGLIAKLIRDQYLWTGAQRTRS